jgi:hypothetical protein
MTVLGRHERPKSTILIKLRTSSYIVQIANKWKIEIEIGG